MHVVGTAWEGSKPLLRVAGPAGLETVRIRGDVAWRVLDRRICTGFWDGGWHACPDEASVGPEGQCLDCFRGRGDPARKDDRPECIFEPRCQGVPQHCVCSFGGATAPVPHVVYLAFHGPLPKVGMTQERRLERRLIEQGADAYLVVKRVADRQAARSTESAVARLHGLPEWRTHRETLPLLTRPVDRDAIAQKADDWMQRLQGRFDVEPGLHWIDHALGVLPGRPVRVQSPGVHHGTWLGAKGNHLFYQARGTAGTLDVGGAPVHAIKRSDLHGRVVETE